MTNDNDFENVTKRTLTLKNMNSKKTVLIKNERELQIMRKLAKIHKEVFEEIKKIAKP